MNVKLLVPDIIIAQQTGAIFILIINTILFLVGKNSLGWSEMYLSPVVFLGLRCLHSNGAHRLGKTPSH